MASFVGKMLKRFRFMPQDMKGGHKLVPAEVDTKTGKLKAVKFTQQLQKLLDAYIRDHLDSRADFEKREERYRDLEYAYYNNAIFSMAVELYSDESVQADAQNQYIKVFARDKKVEKYIIDFFSRIGITQTKLRAAAFDLSLYADHFWVNSIDPKKGITEVTPIEPHMVEQRFEFNAAKVAKGMADQVKSLANTPGSTLGRLAKELLDYSNGEEVSQMFKSYLFGYGLKGDIVLPPWNITHFRRFSTNTEFFPFGRPLLINAISPFRQLQASKNLVALARASNFPIKHWQVKTDPKMTQAEQFEAVAEFAEELKNMGSTYTFKENFATDAEIITPLESVTFDMKTPNIDLQSIADLEMLEDNLIIATKIPKGYLIADKGSFGISGQSLLQQSKIFGRSVYTIQTAILEELTNLVRLQFVITGDFPYDSDFELSMNFPVIEHTAEQIRQKGDTLELVQNTLDKLAGTMGLELSEFPTSIIRDVFAQLSFLNSEDINNWLMVLSQKKKEKQDAGGMTAGMAGGIPGGDMGGIAGASSTGLGGMENPTAETGTEIPEGGMGDAAELFEPNSDNTPEVGGTSTARESIKKKKSLYEKVKSRLTEDLVRECYFKAKQDMNLLEYCDASRERHVYSSAIIDPFQKRLYEELQYDLRAAERLDESLKTFS